MLEDVLKTLIPSEIRVFPKLTKNTEPYHFDRWDHDMDTGSAVLRYWFWSRDRSSKNRKRVFVAEAERLLRNTVKAGSITREDFKRHCPKTNRDGGCGFAVIIAVFESLGMVCHTEKRGVYAITNRELARVLVGGEV
ncbi:MAG: hypothetical protein ACOC6F_01090 [bacterium]